MHTLLTIARPAVLRTPLLKTLGIAAVLTAAGLFPVPAAFGGNSLEFSAEALPLYCLGLLYIGALTWWESTQRRTRVLPSWTSPPALVAGWTVAWIYLPAVECLRGVGRPRAVILAECVGLAVTVVTFPTLVLLGDIIGAACASLLSYVVILVVQRRLMRTPREEASFEFAAEIPPKLEPVA